jgi:hypothetical protein
MVGVFLTILVGPETEGMDGVLEETQERLEVLVLGWKWGDILTPVR